MTNLVIAAGTRVGHAAALSLARKGLPVRAMVRRTETASDLRNAGVEIAAGDLRSADDLARVLNGASRVLLAPPPVHDLPQLERGVIDAIHAAGIRRLVKCSAGAADPNAPDIFARMHWEGEQRIKQLGFDYTIVRPVFYMQNIFEWANAIREDGRFCTPMPANAPTAMIDLNDHAEVAATVLAEDGHAGKSYIVMTPPVLTWQGVAGVLSKALGREIEYYQGDRRQFIAQMTRGGASAWTADAAANIYEHMNEQRDIVMRQVAESPLGPNTIAEVLHRAPGTLEQVVARHIGLLT